MIHTTSILRRLPSNLDRKQLLFLDGIRHTAEIVSMAYSRLQDTLTEIARTEDADKNNVAFSAAFLDAWAIVDGIDRFRLLWKLLPGAQDYPSTNAEPTFENIAQPIRELRNVADHLAQRADHILSKNGTALGSLSWHTATRPDCREGIVCTIAPGTQVKASYNIVNPLGRIVEYPTGAVLLSAGEYQACLSDVLPHMKLRINKLETELEEVFSASHFLDKQAPADILIKMYIVATDDDVSYVRDEMHKKDE